MTISSVPPNNSYQISGIMQSASPSSDAEVRREKENDGDKDGNASSTLNATKPTVNTSGQAIGTTISVTA